MNTKGSFTISLDFELYWGVRDTRSLGSYAENIYNVQKVIPEILKLFSKYEIHATWCIVGFLFFKSKADLLQNLPTILPSYKDPNLNPYKYINSHSLEHVYHFAPGIIKLINETPYQEIGTHTFSHYFTLEDGQTLEEFKADIEFALKVDPNIKIVSVIFPRNQYNNEYLMIVKESGIKYYRGAPNSWVYKPQKHHEEKFLKRFVRLLDSYINISGNNTFDPPQQNDHLPANILGSSFLRPYSTKLKFLEYLKFKRIANSMKDAAILGKGYHLWWHPHNFGTNVAENLIFLEKILKYYLELNKKYGFISKAMCEY